MHVYLLHFKGRINSAHTTQHYLGYAKNLDERIQQHRQGKGARLTQVAKERGIAFQVAEVWLVRSRVGKAVETTEE